METPRGWGEGGVSQVLPPSAVQIVIGLSPGVVYARLHRVSRLILLGWSSAGSSFPLIPTSKNSTGSNPPTSRTKARCPEAIRARTPGRRQRVSPIRPRLIGSIFKGL